MNKNNLLTTLGAAGFCFVIAFISSVRNNAHSFSDLDLVGKIFCILMCGFMIYIVLSMWIFPFFRKK